MRLVLVAALALSRLTAAQKPAEARESAPKPSGIAAAFHFEAHFISGSGARPESLIIDGTQATLLVRTASGSGAIGAFRTALPEDQLFQLAKAMPNEITSTDSTRPDPDVVRIELKTAHRNVELISAIPETAPELSSLMKAVRQLMRDLRGKPFQTVQLEIAPVPPKVKIPAHRSGPIKVRFTNNGVEPVAVTFSDPPPLIESAMAPQAGPADGGSAIAPAWEPLFTDFPKRGTISIPPHGRVEVDCPISFEKPGRTNVRVRYQGSCTLGGSAFQGDTEWTDVELASEVVTVQVAP
jgi:hypothetical protein